MQRLLMRSNALERKALEYWVLTESAPVCDVRFVNGSLSSQQSNTHTEATSIVSVEAEEACQVVPPILILAC